MSNQAELSMRSFMNALRIMRSIDFHEMISAGLMQREDKAEYQIYNEDPYRWAIRLDLEQENFQLRKCPVTLI